MKRYDLVIFDWDGTLMDSIGKIVTCMQATAMELQMTAPAEQSVRDIIGLSMDKALSVLFPHVANELRQTMIDVYRKHYLELNTTPSPLFEGSMTLLDSLREQEYLLAVATGKGRGGLDRVLSLTELGHYFSATRCADESKSKPHPQMILDVLDVLNVEPARALMVGDSIHDLNMANNAGVDCVGVSYGAHDHDTLLQAQPKHIINSPIALLDCLY